MAIDQTVYRDERQPAALPRVPHVPVVVWLGAGAARTLRSCAAVAGAGHARGAHGPMRRPGV